MLNRQKIFSEEAPAEETPAKLRIEINKINNNILLFQESNPARIWYKFLPLLNSF